MSGSRISIAKVAHDDTGERMFTIVGTSDATEKALVMLYTQLENEKARRELPCSRSGLGTFPAVADYQVSARARPPARLPKCMQRASGSAWYAV